MSFSPAAVGRQLRLIGEAVIFRHTVFSFPIAISAILLESSGRPGAREVLLILLAATAGRTAANAINRVIDSDIDKKNPRTAGRHLPMGTLSKKTLVLVTVVMMAVLAVSAALLNALSFFLLPLAGVLIFGYSFTKRFTWLCHYWLGVACAMAPMGAFIGLTGEFAFRFFVLAAAHALWVAGFDIIYAQLDIGFDRKEGIFSIPARFGVNGSRAIAALSHLGVLAAWFAVPQFWPLSPWYYAAAGLAGVLLIAEHVVALGNSERHLKIASYSINEVVPLLILAAVALGVYL